jgi:hypothetical protein
MKRDLTRAISLDSIVLLIARLLLQPFRAVGKVNFLNDLSPSHPVVPGKRGLSSFGVVVAQVENS